MTNAFFYKWSFIALGIAASCTAMPARGADELFSRVSINSVFNSQSGSTTVPPPGGQAVERGRRIVSVDQLADMLRDAGLEPESDGERIASIRLQHAKWTFPVSLGVAENGDEIRLAMTLSQFETGKQPAADRLLALLAANREHQPAFFSFSEKRRQIELFLSLENQNVSPRRLREEIRRLATIAQSTAELWETAESAPSATNNVKNLTTKNSASNDSTPQATTANNLLGKWSAARSKTEAFAMQFSADGTFMLVSVINGKQSKSTGKFTLADEQLTLTTDAGTSTGSIANITANGFEFTPPGKTTAKLRFKRAG